MRIRVSQGFALAFLFLACQKPEALTAAKAEALHANLNGGLCPRCLLRGVLDDAEDS